MVDIILNGWKQEEEKCRIEAETYALRAERTDRDNERCALISFFHLWNDRRDWYQQRIDAAERKIH